MKSCSSLFERGKEGFFRKNAVRLKKKNSVNSRPPLREKLIILLVILFPTSSVLALHHLRESCTHPWCGEGLHTQKRTVKIKPTLTSCGGWNHQRCGKRRAKRFVHACARSDKHFEKATLLDTVGRCQQRMGLGR